MESKVSTKYAHGNAQIFKNPFLERLTKTNPISNIIVYGVTIAFMVYYAIAVQNLSVINFIGLFMFGIVFWTFAEYILHRYVFHWVTEAAWSKRFHFIMHGSHHEFPRDKDRLLMPPVPGLIMASILFGLFYMVFWVLGMTPLVYGFFPGFFSGYLMYSFVHRATHVMRPPKRFKKLWLHHSLHHYKYPDKAFGVSNRFWDRVFGTMPPERH
ncbi:sterol desaturase family protein [Formosa algae]|uniref:Sterol desaturase/sphingolipid hydroxylase (Fatty acid hydroxylase superfamily) n=1 Tax=Formosa algae TaxID=225843 RepID=A0A9X0YMA8_9FLAO|nr:sterol desaturase family protein [Formosa algae]MBP1841387.1 sterol desaturase/sphingolipid hydroxylase (fatty acid hydroxylase superfamily) [Formosa algae]MDQ0336691.1 sterol desaturase/sphingolipid hydroxylase (fatty acid hydroxylase superfamily) [Formosa algae]OEI81850.1 fatty acid hydroxylase [Formosa algae]